MKNRRLAAVIVAALALLAFASAGCDTVEEALGIDSPTEPGDRYGEERFVVRILVDQIGGPPAVGHCAWVDTGASGKAYLGASDSEGISGRDSNGEGTKLSVLDGWDSSGARRVKVWAAPCPNDDCATFATCYSSVTDWTTVEWVVDRFGKGYWLAEVKVNR